VDLFTDFTGMARTFWITDGVLKVAAGSSMVWLSY